MTVTRLTPAGRGAIAVIEVTGSVSLTPPFQPQNRRAWIEQPLHRLLYGQWGAEDVVICRVAADRSEIHCHGGDAAVTRILQDLHELGGEIVPETEQPGRDDDLAMALSQALTARTADLLNEQVHLWSQPGGWSPTEIANALTWAEFGRHLVEPWQVVLTGRPNVGKSSLINALLGYERAIVAAQPGTTRDVVTAITAFEGWPVQLSDTAGQRTTDSVLEAAGIARARAALQSADLQVVVLDRSEPPTNIDQELLSTWPDAIVVAHKCDLPDGWGSALPTSAIPVSSRTGAGLLDLQRELVKRLVPQIPPPGTLISVTAKQSACLLAQL